MRAFLSKLIEKKKPLSTEQRRQARVMQLIPDRIHWPSDGVVSMVSTYVPEPPVQPRPSAPPSPLPSSPHAERLDRAKAICQANGIQPTAKAKVLIIFSPKDSGLPSLIRDGGGLDVATLDYKDDPINQDCTKALLMNQVVRSILSKEYAFVVLENECRSFSIGKDGHVRPLNRPEGRADLSMRLKVQLAPHNRMAMFTAAVIRACNQVDVDFLLETPAPRHDPSSPAWWEKFSDHACLLDLQCMKDVIEDLGLFVLVIAQCKLGGRFQKYTALLMPGRLKTLSLQIFGHALICDCSSHTEVAYGTDAQGNSLSEQAAPYPPGMNGGILELIQRSIAAKPLSFSDQLHMGSARPHEADGATHAIEREGWAHSGSLRQLEAELEDVLLREALPRHNIPNVTDPVDPPEQPLQVPGPFTRDELIPSAAQRAIAKFQRQDKQCISRADQGPDGWKAARALRPEPVTMTEAKCMHEKAHGFSYTEHADGMWHAVLPSTPSRPPKMKLVFAEFKRMALRHGLKDNRTLSYIEHGYPSSPDLPLALQLVSSHVGGLQNIKELKKCVKKDVDAGYLINHGTFPRRWPIIVQPMNVVVRPAWQSESYHRLLHHHRAVAGILQQLPRHE